MAEPRFTRLSNSKAMSLHYIMFSKPFNSLTYSFLTQKLDIITISLPPPGTELVFINLNNLLGIENNSAVLE